VSPTVPTIKLLCATCFLTALTPQSDADQEIPNPGFPLCGLDPLVNQSGEEDDFFGMSISVSGDLMAVGAHRANVGRNGDQGKVFLYKRQGGVWELLTEITAGDGQDDDLFGTSVALLGTRLAVGAPNDRAIDSFGSPRIGATYLYEQNPTDERVWIEVQKIGAPRIDNNKEFGETLSLGPGRLAIGDPDFGISSGFGSNGAVYIYQPGVGGSPGWGLVREIIAADADTGDALGFSISLDGDILGAGANEKKIGDNFDQGAVYLFGKDIGGSNNWGEIKKLTASDGRDFDFFGEAVSLNSGWLAVGAPQYDLPDRSNIGAVYLFQKDFGGPSAWGEVTILNPQDGMLGDRFGSAVSLRGPLLASGAKFADFFFEGGDRQLNRGSTYLYTRDPLDQSAWNITTKFISSVGGSAELFGGALSMSEDYLGISAYGVDIGENSNQGAVFTVALPTFPDAPTITGTTLVNGLLTLDFQGGADVTTWRLEGSADMRSFTTAGIPAFTVQELSPGNYRGQVATGGLPSRFFFRIRQ